MKVRLVTCTPNADAVCNMAAETCISKDAPEILDISANGCKHLKAALRSGHDSVLEHASVSFMVSDISRACSHQLVRHRVASFSQQSQRFVNMDGFEYVKPPNIKDSSPDTERIYDREMFGLNYAYNRLRDHEIPGEDARYVLPNACATNIMVTMNLRELRHFIGLRMCQRSQWEIRELATRMFELVKEVAPICAEFMGPQCEVKGYCPESRGCGHHPSMNDLRKVWSDRWVNDDETELYIMLDGEGTHDKE